VWGAGHVNVSFNCLAMMFKRQSWQWHFRQTKLHDVERWRLEVFCVSWHGSHWSAVCVKWPRCRWAFCLTTLHLNQKTWFCHHCNCCLMNLFHDNWAWRPQRRSAHQPLQKGNWQSNWKAPTVVGWDHLKHGAGCNSSCASSYPTYE